MADRFLECLAVTLTEETGYRQPVGGPYLRHANGSTVIPTRADDRFFSDDPHDTGGRTGAGILQREFDAWNNGRGEPLRDVWRIADEELHAIYKAQYWDAVAGDQLPVGVDQFMLDFSVLCGVGTAIKRMQRALGLKIDGHLGEITLDAAANADAVDLIAKLRAEREAYHRACRTFRYHGKNWLARNKRVAAIATKAAGAEVTAAHLAALPVLDPTVGTPPRAELPTEADSMAASSTGQAANAIGGGGLINTGAQVGQAAQRVAERGDDVTVASVLIELAASPLFWVGVATVLSAAFIWFERRRRMQLI